MLLSEFQAAVGGQDYVAAEASEVPMSLVVLTCRDGRKVLLLVLDVFPAGDLEAVVASADPAIQATAPIKPTAPEAVLNQWD